MDTYNQLKCETKINVYIILKLNSGVHAYAYLHLDDFYPNSY